MSWNKNTFVISEIDSIVRTLQETKQPYEVVELGRVNADGISDSFMGIDSYAIRKLTYGKNVMLEQMQRDPDCDGDDLLVSFEFDQDDQPEQWPLEITLNCDSE